MLNISTLLSYVLHLLALFRQQEEEFSVNIMSVLHLLALSLLVSVSGKTSLEPPPLMSVLTSSLSLSCPQEQSSQADQESTTAS